MATKPITFPNQRANEPHFIAAAQEIAAEMMNFSTEELEETLKINSKLANQNWLRYQHFLQNRTVVAEDSIYKHYQCFT